MTLSVHSQCWGTCANFTKGQLSFYLVCLSLEGKLDPATVIYSTALYSRSLTTQIVIPLCCRCSGAFRHNRGLQPAGVQRAAHAGLLLPDRTAARAHPCGRLPRCPQGHSPAQFLPGTHLSPPPPSLLHCIILWSAPHSLRCLRLFLGAAAGSSPCCVLQHLASGLEGRE